MRALLVALALLAAPGLAAADAPPQGIVHPSAPRGTPLRELGSQLYAANCLSCHGPGGRGILKPGPPGAGGIRGQGPSLRGVGALSADFYLRTGYMPLRTPEAQPSRSRVLFSEREIQALVAYVASLGGGPPVPKPHPERGSLSEGMRLFTENCAGCHQIVGEGGIVTGARVPPLGDATPTQIAEAVRTGPYLMPRFPRSQIGDRQLDSIIAYVERSKHPVDRGGWGIGHIGPVPEGLVAWLLAGSALVAVSVVIARKGR
jgi:ubiquinol-cytochrome c reductase cytochrome c subunit